MSGRNESSTWRVLICLALGAAGLSACARGGEIPTAAIPAEAPKALGPQTAASREHQRILEAYGGLYQDARLEGFVAGVANKLAKVSDRPDITYRVTILNSPAINAFALPNGQLYVTRGLLALANDTSELAAVLAHEMSHVVAKHGVQRADQERQALLVSRVVTDVLENPDAGKVALAKSKIALASFSRSQELEADQIGVRTMARAGYDPYGAVRFLDSLSRQGQLKTDLTGARPSGEAVDFLSSHPSTPERVELATNAARQIGAPGVGDRDRDGYLAAIDLAVFGDDPEQGFARGRRFMHPTLGFAFIAPEGFSFENASDSILGIAPDGRALRLDSVRLEAGQTLESYLASGWIEGAEVDAIESLTVNRLAAATVLAKGRDWTFRLVAIKLGEDVYRIIYAARNLTPEVDAGFRASIESFRRIDPSEARAVRPLRLRIVAARPGETPEMLARRMTGVDRPLERFLVLNGLRAGALLEPGQKVKIVTE
jgi:predicted Zn-dependent protease